MTNTITTFRHPSIDVSGPAELWTALGYQPYSNTEVVGPAMNPDADALILLGIEATGTNGRGALAWALNEKQRRSEEKSRTTAIAREAEAIKALAASIIDSAEEGVLERIISRLSERTQYAVRQQLRR